MWQVRGQAVTTLAYLAYKDKELATKIAASFDSFEMTEKLMEAIDSASWLVGISFEKFQAEVEEEVKGTSGGAGASGIEATDKPPTDMMRF